MEICKVWRLGPEFVDKANFFIVSMRTMCREKRKNKQRKIREKKKIREKIKIREKWEKKIVETNRRSH